MTGIDLNLDGLTPAQILERLDHAWQGPLEDPPKDVPLEGLQVLPEVFQLRGYRDPDPDHVHTLSRIIKERGALDPVEVVPVGGRFFVIDGHHRVAAYAEAGWRDKAVPVAVLTERPSKAALRAGLLNSRPRLVMREWERSEAAWRLVNLSEGGSSVRYSKREIAAAASVSERTVATMRAARKILLERDPERDPMDLRWLKAKAIAEGRDDEWQPMTEEEVEKIAEEYAKRMEKHLGPRFARNPEIAAKAIVKLAPRGAAAIAQAVLTEVGAELEEEFDDLF